MDAGDFGGYKQEEMPWKQTDFLWRMMAQLGYDAVTIGPNEMLEGLDALRELLGSRPSIQVVSANVTDKAGDLLFPESVRITKGGVTYGITGVTTASFYEFNLTKGIQKQDDFAFQDPKASLERVLPTLKDVDVIVVLMHTSPGDARRYVDEIPGMDVVVVGHNPGYMFNPDRVGETLMVRGGNRGMYLSVLELTLDDKGNIMDYSGEGKPLGKDVAIDPEFEGPQNAFEDEFQKAKRDRQREEAAKAAVMQGTEKFLGAEVCSRCHMEEYTSWAATPHAKAYESLVTDEKTHVEECVACHVVGFGEPSGYSFSAEFNDDGMPSKLEDTVHLRGVQCESCHGMGTYHGTSAMNTRPTVDSCMGCHDPSVAKPLDYEQALADGIHH